MKKQVSQKLLDLVENDKEHTCAGYGPDKVCVRAAGVYDDVVQRYVVTKQQSSAPVAIVRTISTLHTLSGNTCR